MKKIGYVFLLFMVMLFPVLAKAEMYVVPETDVSITIDESQWYVFTRGNIKDNKELVDLGISYDYMNNLFTSNNIYLDAALFDETEEKNNLELFIRVVPLTEEVGNLHTYSESQIKEFGDGLLNSGKFNMTSYKIYGNKYKYIEFEYTDLGYNVYQFYTIINGKGYNFTIQKTKEFTEADKTLVKSIIDTVTFKLDNHYERPIGEEQSGSSIKDSAIRGGIIGAIVGVIGAIAAKKKKGKQQENPNTDQSVNNNQPNDYSIGFDTAMNTVLHAADCLRDTCESHARGEVIEVMGRDAGYIALECGISCGANAVAVKELPFDEDACIAKLIELREKGQRSFLVVHSEGMPKGFGENLTERMNKEANIDSRFIRLAHMVRGGAPTLRDRLTATRMGDMAVDLVLDGKSDLVVCERDGKLVATDIAWALVVDRMYKNKLKDGDLEKFSAEQVEAMKVRCAQKKAVLEDMMDIANLLAKN